MTTRFFCFLFGYFLLLAPSLGFTSEDLPPLKLYSTQNARPNPNNAFIERTRAAIEKITGRHVIHYPVTIDELDNVVERNEADILITGAGFYRRHIHNGLRDIATLVSDMQPDPNHAVGATWVVRQDRQDIQSLADLKNRTIAANAPLGFQGLLLTQYEIAQQGWDPERFFKHIEFVGMDLSPAITKLKAGEIDAAILTSCLIETSRRNGRDFMAGLKVIGEKPQMSIQCRVSTELYPNWSLLITPTLDVDTVQKIVLAAHSIEKSEYSMKWAIASDFSAVDRLLETLKLGPYEHLRHWTFQRLWTTYGHWLIFAILMILGLIGHSVMVTRTVQKRTQALQSALLKQKELTQKIVKLQKHFESILRLSMIGQISSIIAHDLSQPLGGILLYIGGLRTLLSRFPVTAKEEAHEMEKILTKMELRAQKANEIVTRVRSYAKNDANNKERLDLGQLVETVCLDIGTAEPVDLKVLHVVKPSHPLFIEGVRFDVEIALANLIRNSWQAVRLQPKPTIQITLDLTTDDKVVLCVEDNGPPLTEEQIAQLNVPLFTNKSEGLGLGLAIVRSIMEKHYGQLTFNRSSLGGLSSSLLFPSYHDASKE